jgi:hypothetical protein
MKKPVIFLSLLLGLGALGMLVMAGVFNVGIGWTIGVVMLGVAAVVALVIAFVEFIDGKQADNIGSYHRPRT